MKPVIMLIPVMVIAILVVACDGMPGSNQAVIGNYIWLDSNRDGIQDPEEEGVKGVSIALYDSQGAVISTTVTDADGYYSFSDLDSGSYFLEFDPPADYIFSPQDISRDDALDSDPNPDTGRTEPFQVQPGQVNLDWDAGIYQQPVAPPPLSTTPTSTPTNTPPPPPTAITKPPDCTCNTEGAKFEVVSYDKSPGWSDCGEATACHSIIGDQTIPSGTIITSPGNACSMVVICPSP